MRTVLGWSAFALALAAPAQAQLASGYSGFEGTREATDAEAWWSLEALGPCLARNRAVQANALLATTPGTQAEADAGRRLLGKYTKCLRDMKQMRLPTSMIRGVIAEAMLDAQPAVALSPIEHPRPGRMTIEQARQIGPYGILARTAACVAAREPARVERLLSTRLGSDAEAGAMTEISSQVANCMPEKMKLEFRQTEVRLSLAEAMLNRLTRKEAA